MEDLDNNEEGSAKTKADPLSASDKALLLEIINAKISIIEDKKTTFATTDKKSKAWEEIKTKFCSQSSAKRNVGQLKEWWKNAKSRAKSDVRNVL